MTNEGTFWGQFASGEGEGFHVDPDKARKVELSREPSSHEGVRVTVVSARGHIRVFTAPKAVLASVIEKLYESDSKEDFRE